CLPDALPISRPEKRPRGGLSVTGCLRAVGPSGWRMPAARTGHAEDGHVVFGSRGTSAVKRGTKDGDGREDGTGCRRDPPDVSEARRRRRRVSTDRGRGANGGANGGVPGRR